MDKANLKNSDEAATKKNSIGITPEHIQTQKQKKLTFPFLSLIELALKDLWHNKITTLSLVAVVCFVCLPLLILTTLKDRYLDILINSLETEFNAKKIEFVKLLYQNSEVEITENFLHELSKMSMVDIANPTINLTIKIRDTKGIFHDFTAENTIPNDPDLERGEFSGNFTHNDYFAIILNDRHKAFFGDISINDSITFYLTRTLAGKTESYPIRCRIAGFLKSGDARKFRLPQALMDDLYSWSRGYGVPKLNLPASEDQENILGPITYPKCRIYLTHSLDAIDSTKLRLNKIKVEKSDHISNGYMKKNVYHVIKEKEQVFIDKEWRNIEELFSTKGTQIVIPEIIPVRCTFNSQPFLMHSTLEFDPIRQDELVQGTWISPRDNQFQIILPETLFPKLKTLPLKANIAVNDIEISVIIVGLSQSNTSYAMPELVFRLNQVFSNLAGYNLLTGKFTPNVDLLKDKKYATAKVFVNDISDVIPMCTWLESRGLETHSKRSRIVRIQQIQKMITNLLMLIGFTGLFAVILAIAGIMFEAVMRKKRQIGIMRTMGLPGKKIVQLFVMEAVLYGVFGYILANFIQLIFSFIADRPGFHQLLGLIKSEPIFNTSWVIRIVFCLLIILLSIISGFLPARYAGKIEPGVVLSERNI